MQEGQHAQLPPERLGILASGAEGRSATPDLSPKIHTPGNFDRRARFPGDVPVSLKIATYDLPHIRRFRPVVWGQPCRMSASMPSSSSAPHSAGASLPPSTPRRLPLRSEAPWPADDLTPLSDPHAGTRKQRADLLRRSVTVASQHCRIDMFLHWQARWGAGLD